MRDEENKLKIGEHFSLMQDSVSNMGNGARILDEIPRICLSKLDPWEGCKERVLILFLARTGSTWLCELMKKTGKLGMPRESLHPQELHKEFEGGLYDNLNEIMLASVEKHSSSNSIYAAKSTFHTLAPMFLLKEFPKNLKRWKIIVLTRKDKVEQAISVFKLNINNQAASWTESSVEIVPNDYDYKKISNKLNNILKVENTISAFLSAYNVDNLEISYESLSEDPEGTVMKIGDFCGLKISPFEIKTQFEIQRDEISAEWKKRWLNDVLNESPLSSPVVFFRK
jgi:LPS sulfotransferase NodH